MRSVTRWWVCAAALSVACSEPRRLGTKGLEDALASERLGVRVDLSAAPGLERGADGFLPTPMSGGYGRRLGAPRGEVVITSSAGVQAKLTPRSGPLDFGAWGPGVVAADAVVYPSADGRAAQVLRPQADGVKEDLVLTASVGDAARFAWTLEVAPGLVAALDDDGSVRVREKSGLVRFTVPAPVVRTRAGATMKQPVRFSLEGEGPWVLWLEAGGLDALGYPLSIDPTLVVSSTPELLSGDVGGAALVSNDTVVVSGQAAAMASPSDAGSLQTPAGLPALEGHAAVASSGFVYVLGGSTGTRSNTTLVAPFSPQSVGSFTASPSTFVIPRSNFGAAVHDGYLYLMGGFDGTSSLSDVQYARINANGTLGPFNRVMLSTALGRNDHCVVAANGYLYFAGGSTGTALSDVHVSALNPDGRPGSFQPTRPLPAPRSGHACVIAGDRFYVVGGSENGTRQNTVYFAPINASGRLGSFVQTTSFPTPRTRLAAAVVEGFLVVSGGTDGTGTLNDLLYTQVHADGTLGAFRLAGTGVARNSHAAVTTGGTLTLIGGLNSSGRLNSVSHSAVLRGPMVPGEFPGAPLAVPVEQAAAVVNRGFLYVVCGMANSGVQVSAIGADGGFTFTSIDAPNVLNQHAAFARDEWLYVVGGRIGGVAKTAAIARAPLFADGGVGVFTPSPTVLPQPLREHTVVVANESMYVVGGLEGAPMSEVVVSTILSGPLDGGVLSPTTPLPSPRWGHASVVHNGKLYVIGGSAVVDGGPGLADVVVASINPNGTLSSFSATTPLPAPRYDHVAVAASGALVVYGGAPGPNTALVAPFLADGGLGAFTAQQQANVTGHVAAFHDGSLLVAGGFTGFTLSSTLSMPIAGPRGVLAPFARSFETFADERSHHASVTANGRLYVLGGTNGTAALSNVQVADLADDGTVGLFTPTALPGGAREGHGAFVDQGRLYVVGGRNGGALLNDVQFAPIQGDGSLGSATATQTFATPRERHAVVAYRGWVYVIGGRNAASNPLDDIQRASIGPTGMLSAFIASTSLPRARHGLTAVAYDGYLYVIGGSSLDVRLPTVEAAPINPDGSLGAFSPRTFLPGGRSEHASFVSAGFLYVVGGLAGPQPPEAFATSDVLYAPISSGGLLGPFTGTKRLPVARSGVAAATWGGRLYVTGGVDDSSARTNEVQVASITTATPVGTYSKLFDTGGRATLASLTVGGSSAARGTVHLVTTTAGETGGFGGSVGPTRVTPGVAVPLGQTNQRYLRARLTLDDGDAVVVNPDAPRRDVTDVSLLYYPNPQLTPPATTCPPRGQVSFTCSGGSGSGYAFSISTNASMGATVNASGLYQAGPNGSAGTTTVTDVIQCVDSQGVTETAPVVVGPGVSISPAAPRVPPRGSVAFGADGGDTTGPYAWSLLTSPSGGAVDGGTGFYVAGATGNVTDVVSVVDRLGNTAQVNVTVGPQVSISPTAVTVPPGGAQLFAADGGSGVYAYSLVVNASDGGLMAGAYRAGSVGNTTDAVRVTDSLGNTATATVTVGPGVSISPASVTLPPRGTQQFTASGGSDAGFLWLVSASGTGGGTISATGLYRAGSIGNTADTVQATDSLGNAATATVSIGPGISVSPASPSTAPRGSITFTASGGSNQGFMFGLVSSQSDASITDAGVYTAGPGRLQGDGGIFDIDAVRVVDSLGNTLDFTVEVTNGLGVTPRAITVPPRSLVSLTVTGGSPPWAWSVPTNRSGGSLDAGAATAEYRVGAVGSVVDEVRVTDTLGEFRTSTITVTAGVSVMPAAASTPPRGSVFLSALGGAGPPFTWSLSTNASGGSITSTGAYTAGATGSVVDVVTATDALGNVATSTITVGAVITVSPPATMVAPLGRANFMATGGSGSYSWTVVSASGGIINGLTGEYSAGSTGGVTDIVQVRDPLGNTASANVTVTGSLSLTPLSPSVAPNGQVAFMAQGGTPPLRWLLMPNRSGGALDMMGGYRAGATPSVVDTVRVTDSLGNTVMTDVAVGVGVSISPANPTIGVGGAVGFTATGGSGQGFRWAITGNVSGSSILDDGTFTAGPRVGLDTVQVTDSLGNTATTSVSVIEGGVVNQVPFAQRTPVSGWSCGCSTGGDALGVVALAVLLGRARRRRGAGLLAVLLVVALPALAAPAATKKKKDKPAATKPAVTPQPTPVTPPAPPPEPPPAPVVALPPPAPAPKDGKLSVAVLDVDVTVPNEKLDAAAFSEMLVNSIDGTGMFRVISSKEIVTLLGLERQRQLLGCSEDSSCMAEIANALGSELVAQGSVGKVGATYLVSVRLIDGRSSRTAARANAEVTDPNALLRAVWTSSQEMLDKYGASLPPEQAARWAARPKQQTPAQVAVDTTPNFFGVQAGAVAGYQVLSEAGKRGSIGAQVDLTFRRGRLDLAAGLIIGPNLGVRITATWALLASRFRLGVGVRAAGYPGLGLYGGGLATTAEFTIVSVWSAFATGGAEISPGGGAPVLVLLGTVGTGVRF